MGLRLRSWTDPQLSSLQAKLQKIDWYARVQSGARTEWAYQIELARSGEESASSKAELNQVFHEFRQKALVDPLDAAKRATKEVWLNVRPKGFDQSQAMRELRQSRTYPEYSDREQTSVNAKRVVLIAEVALERYRLKHGAVPGKLDALVPEFLPEVPKDISDGQPLRYQVLPDGSPHVWSIWPSGKDEGGMPKKVGAFSHFLCSFAGSTPCKVADMRLPPWLWRACRSKWTKRSLIASPVLLTAAIVGFYGIANWYGSWAIERETQALRAAGWPVSYEEVVGLPSSAEDDVFQHPVVVRELELPNGQQLRPLKAMASSGTISGITSKRSWRGNADLSRLSDVRELVEPARPHEPEMEVAKGVRDLMQPQSRRLDEMMAAFSGREIGWSTAVPSAPDIPGIELPLSRVKFWAMVAYEHALVCLAAGDASTAAKDVEFLFACHAQLERRPLLSFFVAAEAVDHWVQEVIWEGIKRGMWNDAQLVRFAAHLSASNAEERFLAVMRTEAALLIAFTKSAKFEATTIDWERMISTWIRQTIRGRDPRGTLGTLWYLKRPTGLKKLEVRDAIRGLKAEVDSWGFAPNMRPPLRNLSLLPNRTYEEARKRAIDGGVKRGLVLTGIALERYRLKHGTTPRKLEALVPEFLPEVPKDIYDGQPLRYQVLPDGSPHVWSIWPSGKDEGIPNWYRRRNTVWATGRIPGLTEADYDTK